MDGIFDVDRPISAIEIIPQIHDKNVAISLCGALKQAYEQIPKYSPVVVIKDPGRSRPLPEGFDYPTPGGEKPEYQIEIDVQVRLNNTAMEILETAVRFGCQWAIEEQARIRESIGGKHNH